MVKGRSTSLAPVAQYIRMSAEHQRYSADNQAAAIELYAAARGFEVVQTYADLGRSGLTLKKRPALQQLLADVGRGSPGFQAVLVYDVSRWGRFQDPDEAAFFEQSCKRAGISVHYCAEVFENDGTVVATILKSLKRAMAAEYSRELSNKVLEAQRRAVRLGYLASKWAPLGTRRMLVDPSGRHVRVLEKGEKNMRGFRVTLVPGPPAEQDWARRIFQLYARKGWGLSRLARTLNEAGIANPQGSRWAIGAVRNLVRSEIYIGNIVYGRTSSKLGGPARKVEASDWVRGERVLAPIVSRRLFADAQKRLAASAIAVTRPPSDDEMLALLSRLYARHGHLSSALIKAEPGMRCASYYARRFGTLLAAYQRIGFEPGAVRAIASRNQKSWSERSKVFAEVAHALGGDGFQPGLQPRQSFIVVDDAFSIHVRVCRPKVLPRRAPFWVIRDHRRAKPNLTLVARLDVAGAPIDYCLVATRGFRGRRSLSMPLRLADRDGFEVFGSLDGLQERCVRLMRLPHVHTPGSCAATA